MLAHNAKNAVSSEQPKSIPKRSSNGWEVTWFKTYEREIIMDSQFIDLLGKPFPGPYYLCPSCWDQSMDDMEEYYED